MKKLSNLMRLLFPPAVLFGVIGSYSLLAPAGSQLRGTVATIQPVSRAIRNGKIAFVEHRDFNGIFTINPDGTNLTRVTNGYSDDRPSWSPDGRRLAFSRDYYWVDGTDCGVDNVDCGIYVMNADGSNVTKLTGSYDIGPTWSPDGTRIAFNRTAIFSFEGTIFVMNADGSQQTPIYSGNVQDLAWSPDGSKIAFSTFGLPGIGIRVVNPDGSNLAQITSPPPPYFDKSPAWSADGSTLAFVRQYCNGLCQSNAIWTVRTNGTDPAQLAVVPLQVVGITWSPDGTKLAFSSLLDLFNHGVIYTMNANGSGLTPITSAANGSYEPSWQRIVLQRALADFDGDGRSDVSVFRPSDPVWYLSRSTQGFSATQFGLSTDTIAPADYDGDGKTDIAVFRNGVWWWIDSSNSTVNALQFGSAADIPVPADYSGDGRDEVAVYRNGQWWMLNLTSNQATTVTFGLAGDKPLPADFDGDGKADQNVYRNGEWHMNRSTLGYTVVPFGLPTDIPVPADYDADGKTDQAVYRGGIWYAQQSTEGFSSFQWGIASDVPVPADYDGDGKTDAAVYRDGIWYLRRSTSGVSIQQFGLLGDKPVAAAYLR